MNVFELASQFNQLERLVDAEYDIPENDLLAAWLSVEGDLNHKLENLGFAIRNREATLAGKQEAIKHMEASAMSLEKEITRLKTLALSLLQATGHKKAGGQYLTLSTVANPPRVEIENEAALPAEYLRVPDPKPVVAVADKKKILEDAKAGVIVPGVKLVRSERLAIR